MILPSKELVIQVLKNTYSGYVREFKIHENNIRINPMYRTGGTGLVEYGCEKSINIYELMHMMKEWLHNRNVMFDIQYATNRNPHRICVKTYGYNSAFYCGENEFEAVTKACERVLEQQK